MLSSETLIGRQFANFRILRLLGKGGMAEVYYGWDVKLERPVAIKVIDARYRHNPEYAQRFVNEARAMAAWHHPNIIPIYYADDEGGYYYYAMEYIQGLDLEQVLSEYAARGELVPLEDVIRIGRAAAEALDYAHHHGVIHRDVKPSNLLISTDGRVVLTDFGLAMHVQQGSLGEVFGSPQYIAPEQARNSSDAVPQSDLYALGVILYEMLTGALPFDDPSPTSLAVQHLTLEPPPPRQLNPNLNPAVEAVLLKILSKSPGERYSSGKELMDALDAAISIPPETSPFLASPAPQGEEITRKRPPRSVSRNPVAEVVSRSPEAQASFPLEEPSAEIAKIPGIRRSRLAQAGIGCGVLLALGSLIFFLAILAPGRARDAAQANAPSLTLETRPAATRTPTGTEPLPLVLPGNTPTKVMTLTPSQIPTRTAQASATSTATDTAVPASPTATHAPQPSPAPTKPPKGDHFAMYYDYSSFYIKNLSGKDRSVYPLAFEQLDNKDNPINRFDGWRWATFYSKFRAGYCMVLEIINITQHLSPPECRNRYLVIRTPTSDADYIFWTKNKNSKEFRVLWNDEEVGRCKIAAGTCDVYLP